MYATKRGADLRRETGTSEPGGLRFLLLPFNLNPFLTHSFPALFLPLLIWGLFALVWGFIWEGDCLGFN